MLQAGYYLDSLTAFLEKDPKRLAANLKLVDGAVRSPVARMIGLYSAIGTRDLPEVEKQLTALRDGAATATIRERACPVSPNWCGRTGSKTPPVWPGWCRAG